MEIMVSARQVEVTSALRSAVDEKIGRLSRYVEGMDRAEVHFSEERNPRIAENQVCEVTLEGHGHVVRCRAAAIDPFAAVDIAEEKLEVQLRKLKTRVLQRRHKGPRTADLDVVTPDDVWRELSFSSVRRSARASLNAGMMPISTPVIVSTSNPNNSTVVSIGTASRRGKLDAPSARINRTAAAASAKPSIAPTAASSIDSISN